MADTPAPPGPLPSHVGGLGSRTFVGLLVAQFFAAFNDQAIHAAAMFYAINKQLMTEADAISLMPILFYSPWAIFCTVAGHLADKYPKRNALVIWKVAEVVICGVALLGFWLGNHGQDTFGPVLVLGCVFLMGVHSAFFVPAKYGVMPEILPPHLLSRGNGMLESLSFLAVILGTVCGGVLSYVFLRQEEMIGVVLLALAVVGAVASLLIRKMPAANPDRKLPANIYGPIVQSLKTLLSTKALRVAILGIAFFTFVVAFMRAAVYMLGESQNPRWDELKTSVIVGTVALGIGIGSPLAGMLSGRRVELRLVLAGAVGMITLLGVAAWQLTNTPVLVACIIGVGISTGFYIVPLFTLLQHRAPKTSKGEMIATSNFVNVVGAITATLLFRGVVAAAHATDFAPEVKDREMIGHGNLRELEYQRGRPVYFVVGDADGPTLDPVEKPKPAQPLTLDEIFRDIAGQPKSEAVIDVNKGVGVGTKVTVTKFDLDGVPHYELSHFGVKWNGTPDYDNKRLPVFLFLGAAGLTLLILIVLGKPLLDVRKAEAASEGHH